VERIRSASPGSSGYGLTVAENGTSGERSGGDDPDVQQNHPIIVTSRAHGEATGS
jgi:hypothetical protein